MNNLSLPSNDVNKKNINLDLFPSEIIENVEVSKAYNSYFYGDFSAGNVNINSKEYTGPGYFAVSFNSGFNSNAIGEDFVRSEGPSYFGFTIATIMIPLPWFFLMALIHRKQKVM